MSFKSDSRTGMRVLRTQKGNTYARPDKPNSLQWYVPAICQQILVQHTSLQTRRYRLLLVLGWLEIAITVCWRVPIDYSWLVLKKHTCASWCPRNGICIFFKKKEKLGTMKPQQPQPCPPQKEQSKKKKLVYHNPQGPPNSCMNHMEEKDCLLAFSHYISSVLCSI